MPHKDSQALSRARPRAPTRRQRACKGRASHAAGAALGRDRSLLSSRRAVLVRRRRRVASLLPQLLGERERHAAVGTRHLGAVDRRPAEQVDVDGPEAALSRAKGPLRHATARTTRSYGWLTGISRRRTAGDMLPTSTSRHRPRRDCRPTRQRRRGGAEYSHRRAHPRPFRAPDRGANLSASTCHRRTPRGTSPAGAQPSSSGLTSSMWVATVQPWPNGSTR